MSKINVFTVANLLAEAADYIRDNTSSTTGNHPDVSMAIVAAAEGSKYRKEVPERALKLFKHHFPQPDLGVPKTGNKGEVWGKRYSETRNKHAVTSVLKNRDARVDALNKVSSIARKHSTQWYK